MQQVFFSVFIIIITCGFMQLYALTLTCLIAGPPEIIIKKEYIEDETVTSVVLADNNYLV